MFSSPANRFLLSLAREKSIYLLISLVLSLSSIFLNLAGTILIISTFFILLNSDETIAFPDKFIALERVFYRIASQQQFTIKIIILILCLFIFKSIANYFVTIIEFKYSKRLIYTMQTKALSKLCNVNLDYYQENRAEDILIKLNREIEKTALAINSGQKLLVSLVAISLLIGLLFYISWLLTLLVLIFFGAIYFINSSLNSWSKNLAISLPRTRQLLARKTIDLITGIRTIKALDKESDCFLSITQTIKDKDCIQLNTQSVLAMSKPTTEIMLLVMLLVLIVFSRSLSGSQTDIIVFSIYLTILFVLLPWIERFNYARIQFKKARPSVETVNNFLAVANKSVLSLGNVAFTELKTEIEFQNVTFAYPKQARIVLDKISFSLPKGKTIAIIELSTVESAIADLLARFYDPIEGQISIDGRELKEYQTATLRRATAIVSSNTFLFDNSLAYNIIYGTKNVAQTDLVAATKKAGIYDFISGLPEGFATKVSDRSLILSKEQKQKIGIARAFLRNPQILILDKPTEMLNFSERESVQKALELLSRGRTTLIITRQLDLAKKAHQIIVLDRGKIVESGSHQKLLQQSNIYRRLYLMQFESSKNSHRQLTKKIAQKLARQSNSNLSEQIHANLDSLLSYIQLVNEGLFEDEQQENQILDESYQSAKNMLISLQEYERKIARRLKNIN